MGTCPAGPECPVERTTADSLTRGRTPLELTKNPTCGMAPVSCLSPKNKANSSLGYTRNIPPTSRLNSITSAAHPCFQQLRKI